MISMGMMMMMMIVMTDGEEGHADDDDDVHDGEEEEVEKIKQTAHPFLQKTKSYKRASRFLRNLVLQMLIVNGWIEHPSFNGSGFSS